MANLTDKPKDFTLEDNTASKVVKANEKDKIEVEIGDAHDPDFKPQVKIKRWDNEVNFSMRAEEDPTATTVVEDDIVKYKAQDYEVHMYEKPEVSEDGGFEFEWVLDKKPESNVFRATIQTKELNFFYQPALTQEEIDEGAERPENIEGSYAVYHKTKKNNKVGGQEYKAGKAFHIFRPKAIDADGVEEWCELNIDEGEGKLTVTAPQDYLDSAKYPVVIDPTFGYETAGATGGGFFTDDLIGDIFTAPADGTIQTFHASVLDPGADGQIKGVLVENSGRTIVTNGITGAVTVTNTSQEWVTTTFGTDPSITDSTDYILTIIADTDAVVQFYDTAGTPDDAIYDGGNSFSSPVDMSGETSLPNRQDSIYATYTADTATVLGNPVLAFL